jgi:hypothetical protein
MQTEQALVQPEQAMLHAEQGAVPVMAPAALPRLAVSR